MSKTVAVACVVAIVLAALVTFGVAVFVLPALVLCGVAVLAIVPSPRPRVRALRPALIILRSSRHMPRASLPHLAA